MAQYEITVDEEIVQQALSEEDGALQELWTQTLNQMLESQRTEVVLLSAFPLRFRSTTSINPLPSIAGEFILSRSGAVLWVEWMSILRIQVGKLSHGNIRSMVKLLESFNVRHRNEEVLSGKGKATSYPYLRTMLSHVGEGLKEEDALRQRGLEHSRTLTVHYDPDRLEAIPLPVREKLVEQWKEELPESEEEHLETFSAHFWELLREPQKHHL